MINCKPKYKNLNRIQSFSEQRYVTVQLLEQACMNDEYLKQFCDKLYYLTPPVVRKTFKDMGNFIDESKSFGYQLNSNDEITFSSSKHVPITVDFNDLTLIDLDKTTASIVVENEDIIPLGENETYENTEGTDGFSVKHICRLPTHAETVSTDAEWDFTTRNFKSGDTCDSAWYVGFNKSKNYYIRPDWLTVNKWRDYEIPSIVRAQTFKAKTTGTLVAVDLRLEYNGAGYHSTAGSPLYVQIWRTHKRKVNKIKWDSKKNKSVYEYESDGKTHKKETVIWPGTLNEFNENGKIQKFNDRYHPLTEAVYDPKTQQKGMFPTIVFDKPIQVEKGYSYAIVLFSPLSEWKHCPRWAGWGRNSVKDKYADGMAFYSENNGYSFMRHGPNDLERKYDYGKYSPCDFAFQCHIRTKDESTSVNNVYNEGIHYLYLKPIYSNPITEISISTTDTGETTTETDLNIKYQFSTNGKDWIDIDNTNSKILSEPSKMLLFRALLWRDSTTLDNDDNQTYRFDTPIIENIRIDLTTQAPEEMYVRTPFYTPKPDTILGAKVWGRVFAPFKTEPYTDCTVEIIESTTPVDHFRIISLDELAEEMHNFNLDGDAVEDLTINQRANYLVEHPRIVSELKNHQVYVKPIVLENKLYKFSFTPNEEEMIVNNDGNHDLLNGILFTNHVASPVLECKIVPESNLEEELYSEFIDFDFDYSNDILIFDKNILMDMPIGDLQVTYNRIFIDGLSNDVVGVHPDDGTGIKEEGLILDYFKEEIIITNDYVEKRRIPLKVKPLDPIREVTLNKDTDDELSLYEGFDYDLDIESNELVFKVVRDDGVSPIYSVGDELTIVYTPNLDCESIAIGYHAKRTKLDNQVYIKGNYIEYKV